MIHELRIAADLCDEMQLPFAAAALRGAEIPVPGGHEDSVETIGRFLRHLNSVNGLIVIDAEQLRSVLCDCLADVALYATDPDIAYEVCRDLEAVLADMPTRKRQQRQFEFQE